MFRNAGHESFKNRHCIHVFSCHSRFNLAFPPPRITLAHAVGCHSRSTLTHHPSIKEPGMTQNSTRREFLKSGLGAAGVLATGSLLRAETATPVYYPAV